MKKRFVNLLISITVFIFGMSYGFLIYHNKIFPYKYIEKIYYYLIENTSLSSSWSIGIYEGTSPFNLEDPEEISNPVLTSKDVTDVDALFVADPFMIIENKKYTMFFEVLNLKNNQGDIGYAESLDGKNWEYKKIVIDEDFHLSYPYIFKSNGNYYLIPESNQDLSVRLYKALSFPTKWEYVENILTGYRYTDPSIFQYNNKWWLFVTTPYNDSLNLYYSESLMGEWNPHPMNPIVKGDKNIARPGGRVITYDNRIFRLTQDDDPSYGIQVFAFEITKLSETSYEEKIASKNPIITFSGKGWNRRGMHHIDLHELEDKWIGAVDGRN